MLLSVPRAGGGARRTSGRSAAEWLAQPTHHHHIHSAFIQRQDRSEAVSAISSAPRFTLGQDATFAGVARLDGTGCVAGSATTCRRRSGRSNQRSKDAFVRCQTGAASRHPSSAASLALENAAESCRQPTLAPRFHGGLDSSQPALVGHVTPNSMKPRRKSSPRLTSRDFNAGEIGFCGQLSRSVAST